MRVAFAADALADPRAHRHLTAVWWMCQDGRHIWHVDDEALIRNSAWVAQAGPRLGRELCGSAREAERGGARKPKILVRRCGADTQLQDGCWATGADEAERYLRRPVEVLVENVRVDGAFLKLVVEEVGRSAFARLLGTEGLARMLGRWRTPLGDGELFGVRHGGGDTVSDLLSLTIEDAVGPPPRLLVMVDSDRDAPGGPVKQTAQRVLDLAADSRPHLGDGWSPRIHVFEKREVENYLPHKALCCVRGHSRIPETEADFGDLKELFREGRTLARDVLESPQARVHCKSEALRERCGNKGRELDVLVRALLDQL